MDAHTRNSLTELGASQQLIDTLLEGQTLRGVTDDELATITKPVGVLPSVPVNPFHQRRTVDALLDVLPNAAELPGVQTRCGSRRQVSTLAPRAFESYLKIVPLPVVGRVDR